MVKNKKIVSDLGFPAQITYVLICIMYLKSCDSQRARAPGERAHIVKKCTNEFVDPKNSMIDTKNIEIGQQEGARGFVQFFSILAQCALWCYLERNYQPDPGKHTSLKCV